MSIFQNTNIAFRCPASLKEKMKIAAEQREEHLSNFIRSACVERLSKEFPRVYCLPESPAILINKTDNTVE